jgi:hypothetical protein
MCHTISDDSPEAIGHVKNTVSAVRSANTTAPRSHGHARPEVATEGVTGVSAGVFRGLGADIDSGRAGLGGKTCHFPTTRGGAIFPVVELRGFSR